MAPHGFVSLEPGDRIVHLRNGGGSCGDFQDRPKSPVLAEVQARFISIECATRDHDVVAGRVTPLERA